MDLLDYARTAFALLATLALIVGCAYAARRFGMLQPGGPGIKRMRVTETLLIDTRRRMVIVRVDDREHVMLLGPTGDLLVTDMAAPETPAPEPTAVETTT